MAVKRPDKQPRHLYYGQQLREIHEVIDSMLEEGKNKRDTGGLYLRAHKCRDALDEALEILAASQGEGGDHRTPEEAWQDLVSEMRQLPRDVWDRLREEVEGPALRLVGDDE